MKLAITIILLVFLISSCCDQQQSEISIPLQNGSGSIHLRIPFTHDTIFKSVYIPEQSCFHRKQLLYAKNLTEYPDTIRVLRKYNIDADSKSEMLLVRQCDVKEKEYNADCDWEFSTYDEKRLRDQSEILMAMNPSMSIDTAFLFIITDSIPAILHAYHLDSPNKDSSLYKVWIQTAINAYPIDIIYAGMGNVARDHCRQLITDINEMELK